MTTSLVVGCTGNIGSALLQRLQSTGATVWGTSHKAKTGAFYLNLLDHPTAWQLPDTPLDVAYLCAGVCRMALCEEDPIGTRKANVIGMSALAKQLADNGTFIVYLSTNQVFSGENAYEAANAPYQPVNEYGRQKSDIETFIKTYCPKHAIVRLTKVIEPNMTLIKNWIDQLIQHQTVKAFHDMPLAPVSLRQVIDTLLTIGQRQRPGIYQISGKKDASYYILANYLVESLKLPISLVQSMSAIEANIKKNFLPRFTTLDCSSTIALGGEEPPHFSDVLRECFEIGQ